MTSQAYPNIGIVLFNNFVERNTKIKAIEYFSNSPSNSLLTVSLTVNFKFILIY